MLTSVETKTVVTVRTEEWVTRKGIVAKAVVRDSKGRFNGATNKTRAMRTDSILNLLFFR